MNHSYNEGDSMFASNMGVIEIMSTLIDGSFNFKNKILQYLDSVESRIEEFLKGSDKVTERKLIKALRKKIKGIPDDQFLSVLARSKLQDTLKGLLGVVAGEISKKDFLFFEKIFLGSTGNPLLPIQKECERIEKKLKLKKGIPPVILSDNDAGISKLPLIKESGEMNFQVLISDFQDSLSMNQALETKVGRIQLEYILY